MSTAKQPSDSEEYDLSDLPRRIRQIHDDDDPWWEYKGEPLFGDNTDVIRERVADIANANDVGRYSPRNGFRETTKIRTKDTEAFEESLKEQFETVNEEFGFLMADRLFPEVTTYEKGPRRTDVTFSPRFGRPVGIGGADYYREQIATEILRYEVEVFWERVVQPVFEEYNEKYPY